MMNRPARTLHLAVPASAPLTSRFAAALAGLVCLSVVVSMLLGRDLNWDFLNYHYYGAALWLEGRLAQDYFAASLQSYLNPLAYIPQYLMIQAGWHSAVIGALLAAFHSLNLVLAALITRQLLPEELREGTALPVLGALLAMLAPLYLTTAGSSFSDATTSVLVLSAVWLLLADPPGGKVRGALIVGLLLGAATGLKMTNAVLAVGIVAAMAAFRVGAAPWATVRWLALATVAGVAGWLAMHGYWSFLLWREFGNPLFPLFNSLFQSPDFPGVTFRDERFVASGPTALLTLPFQMVTPVSWLYAENAAVDFRFAALVVVLGLVALGLVVRRRLTTHGAPGGSGNAPSALVQVTAAFVVTYLLWGLTSKIGRYALPLWLLLGPLFVAWAVVLVRRTHLATVMAAGLLVIQLVGLSVAHNPRWSPAPWSEAWLEVDVPDSLKQAPATLVTLGTQSYSFVVPFLHPEARVVNLVGQYVQPAGEDIRPRLRALLEGERVFVAFRDSQTKGEYDGALADRTRIDVNQVLSVYGLELQDAVCQPLDMHLPINAEGGFLVGPQQLDGGSSPTKSRLHVCPARPAGSERHRQALEERRRVNAVLDRIELACGSQLEPHGGEAIRGARGWMRVYFNTQNSLMTDGQNVLVRPFRSMVDVDLGRFEGWQTGALPACPDLRRPSAWP